MKKLLGVFVLIQLTALLFPSIIVAQSNQKEIVLEIEKREKLSQVFKLLEKASNFKIMFITEEVNQYEFQGTVRTKDIHEALKQIIGSYPLTYTIDRQFITVTAKGKDKSDSATKEPIRLKGKVVDENGLPLPGANVIIHGTHTGTVSDLDGEFSLKVQPNDVLNFTFIGYKTDQIPIKGRDYIKVEMEPESKNLQEVTVVAFGEQKKESVVSSITTVRPGDLKSASSDLTTSFAGKIPGMIAWQTGGLPGALTEDEMNTKFYIRGITSFQSSANSDPLILIDGVESSKLELSRLVVEDIESFSVLKDASATAMYGARGANGVILVTTKKGEEGSVYTTARYEVVVSRPTKEIDVVDPITYMKMYNQAIMGRSNAGVPKYSVEYINRTASGRYPSWMYPTNDWYKLLFKDQSINHRAGVTIRGGSKVIQYYASVNYNYDQGMLKSDKLNDYDCNISNHQVGFRTNLNINLTSGIRLVINSSTNIDKYHGPDNDQTSAYQYAFNASPVDFAPIYPADATYNWPHIRFGTTSDGAANPYMENQKGYKERTRYSTTNKAEYIHNLSSLVRGLEARLSVSYVQSGYYDNTFTTTPYKYYLKSYDFETGEHTLAGKDNALASKTLRAGRGGNTTDTRVTYEGRLYHTAAWGNHQTSLTGVVQAYERTFTPIQSVLNGMPQRNLTYSVRGSYGYKDRYFGEVSVGYNGSERFAKGNRMGVFPAFGAAWVASNEKWMQRTSDWLSFLKFRFSWGKVGNDGIISTPRYVYLQDIGSTSSGTTKDVEAYRTGGFNRRIINFYGDEDIQWEIAEQANLGVETKLFKGLLEIQADIYQEFRHNILSKRYVIPANVGIEVAPLDNIGKTRSRGIDLSAKIQHQFSNDFWVILNGTLTYNKVKYEEIEEATNKPSWQRMKGKEISQAIGYIAEGLFRDEAEIANSPRQDGDVMPGDIKYRDLNGDGSITVADATYIGYPETPRLIYGFSGFINYKRFEFSFSFQGSGKRTFFVNPSAISPFVGNHAMLTAIYNDHWSEDNMATRPFWPRLSPQNITAHNPQENWYAGAETRKSTYFMRECSFLRCTSIQLAYNMPRKLLNKWRMQNMKFFVSTNNPFCFTNFKLWDVELGENGFNYPIQRTYSLGFNISF